MKVNVCLIFFSDGTYGVITGLPPNVVHRIMMYIGQTFVTGQYPSIRPVANLMGDDYIQICFSPRHPLEGRKPVERVQGTYDGSAGQLHFDSDYGHYHYRYPQPRR